MFQPRSSQGKRSLLAISVFLFFCLFCLPCYASQSRFNITISGKVTDQNTSAPIPNAVITLSNLYSQNYITSTVTDSAGYYRLRLNLSRGSYGIACSAANYIKTSTSKYVTSGTYAVNFTLKPVSNRTPQITSFLPANKSTFFLGNTVSLKVTATDADNDPLLYRFFLDSTVLSDWSNNTAYNFNSNTTSSGRHRLKVEVKDNRQGTATKTSDIFIFMACPGGM